MNRSETPRVQCSTGPFWAYELERALDAVAEAGFVDVELMVTRDPATQDPDLPLQLARERGLRIASVHGPFLVITKTVWGLDPIQKIHRGVEMCKAMNATSLIVHPPYLWEREYARFIKQDMSALCDQAGIRVAVETMYPKWVAGRRMRGYRWLDPDRLVQEAPFVALDTSHVTVARQDIFDAYRSLRPRLVHIHLSNNNGDGRDGHLEVEQGILQLDRFLAKVKETGYANAVSLELSIKRYVETPKELVGMLKRNREYVEAHLAGKPRVEKGPPRR